MKYYSTSEASRLLQINARTLRYYVKEGMISAEQRGYHRRMYFSEETISDFLYDWHYYWAARHNLIGEGNALEIGRRIVKAREYMKRQNERRTHERIERTRKALDKSHGISD